MLDFKIVKQKNGKKLLKTSIYGKALLTIPQLNKGTAFTETERLEFDLIGKLPAHVETLEDQVKRAYQQYMGQEKEIQKNSYLNYLLNVNQVLFYKLIREYTTEMLPKIYTPVVGEAVEQFSQRFVQSRGLYIAYEDKDRIDLILNNRSNSEIEIIVVSDGEGVLGIGDQGAGAMAIPVAKLMVYSAIGGINPNATLPIMLDVGTNNQKLLHDPMYLGWRHPRVTGKEYEDFINKFIKAIKKHFPKIFLQWEDFGSYNAYNNLVKYRKTICSFNDDIQGTGVVTIAAILAGLRHTKQSLVEQRIIIFGAGSAGMGVTESIYKAMLTNGMSENAAKKCFWLVDRHGLITEYTSNITLAQSAFLRKKSEIDHWPVINKANITLLEVVENVRPTILIGCSTMYGAFTQEVITAMAKYVDRPIILPLSNPTSKSEAHPADLIAWTRGKALIATGSPFPDVVWEEQCFPIRQCNNYLVFPGIGLGVIAVKAKEVSEKMLWAASLTLSQSTQSNKSLLPSLSDQLIQESAREIAVAVAKAAIAEGLNQINISEAQVEARIKEQIWKPEYLPYQRI